MSGPTAFDETLNIIHGTYLGTPTLASTGLITDPVDTAVTFNGTDSAVQIPDSLLINVGGPYESRTIELWFNANDVTTRQVLYEEGGGSKGFNIYLDGGLLYFNGWNTSDLDPTTPWGPEWVTTPVEINTTYHVVLVYEYPDRIEGFVDGQSIGTVTGPVGRLFIHARDTGIGSMVDTARFHDSAPSGNGFYFDGVIDEVALYDAALGAQSIADHYFSGVTVGGESAPEAETVAPADLAIVNGSVTVQVAASDLQDVEGSLTVEVAIDGGSYQVAAWNAGSGFYEYVWDTTLETEGAHTVDARATDSVLNVTDAVQVSVTVDNVDEVPVVAVTAPLEAATVNGLETVEVDATDPEDALGTLTVEVSTDGGGTWNPATWNGVDRYEFVWDTTVLTPGSYTVDARATDSGFNVGNAVQVNVTVEALSYPERVAADGPITYWRLGEASGTTAFDETVNSIDATYLGVPGFSVGSLTSDADTAVDFNGTDAAVHVPDSSLINLGGPYEARSVEFWFNADDVTAKQVLFEEGGITRGFNVFLDSGLLYVMGWNVNVDDVTTPWGPEWVTTPVTTGTTYHVVMVYEYPDRLEGFVDGVSIGSVTGPVGRLFNHSRDAGIGGMVDQARFHNSTNVGNGFFFDGVIDDVSMSPLAFSAQTVWEHYYAGITSNGESAPTAQIVVPTDSESVVGTLTVQVDANDLQDVVGSLTVEVAIDGGSYQVAPWNVVSGFYEFSWDTTLETEGNHTVDARATDSALNATDATQISVEVDNDNAPPTAAITAPSNGDPVSGIVTIEIDATDVEDALGTLTVEVSFDDGSTWSPATWNGVDRYEYDWDTTALSAGGHHIDARATDSRPNLTDAAEITVVVPASTYADHILADGPVVFLRLGEASGTTAFDETVSALDGTYLGTPTLGAGALITDADTAVDFNGTDSAVTIPDSTLINLGGPFESRSVELWFNADDVTTRQVLFEEGGIARGLSIYVDGGDLYFTGWNSNADDITTPWGPEWVTTPVSTGTTYHVVMVYEYPDRLEGFVNGSSIGSVSGPVGRLFRHSKDTGFGAAVDEVRFHDSGSFGNGFYFDGVIDEIAVYSAPLSATDVSDHFAASGPSDAAPTIEIDDPADASTIVGSTTIVVDATDAEDALGALTVEVSIDGGAFTAAVWNATTSRYEQSWDTTLILDGSHTIDARVTDSAVQVTNATQVSVTVDNFPDVPTVSITAPVEAETVSGNSYVVPVDATDDADALGTLTVEVSVDGGPWQLAAWNTVDAYEFIWDTTLETDGAHTVDARATDSDVNQGNATQVNVTSENDADPTVSITAPVEAELVSGSSYTVAVDATDDLDAFGSLTVEVSIDGGAWQVATWNTVDAYEFIWDTTLLGDGPHTVDARATDSALQTTAATQVNVTVDNVADVPAVSITAPVEAEMVSGAGYAVSIDGGPWQPAPWNTVDAYEFVWDTTAETEGPHTVDARATDSDVNVGAATQVNVTVENDADPVVSITAPVEAETVSGNSYTVAVDATDVEDALGSLTVEVSIDGGPWLTAPWNTVDAYEYTWDTTAIGDGPHTVDARAMDSAPQTTVATQVNVTVDNVADVPSVSITAPVEAEAASGSSYTVAVDATDDIDAIGSLTVEVSIDGGPWQPAPWNTVDAYEFVWDTTLETEAPHTVDARATDSELNEGNATQVNVTAENDADPVVSITGPVEAGTVSGSTYTVSVDATDDIDALGTLTVEVSVDGGFTWNAAPWNLVDAYEFSWDTTLLPDGPATVDARATDSKTQTTDATQVNVTVDNIADAPVVMIVEPSDLSTVAGVEVIEILVTDDIDADGVPAVDVSTDGGSTWNPATWNIALARYEFNWDTTLETEGPATIDARATDSELNVGFSTTINVTVDNDADPVVSITAPLEAATVSGASFTVSVDATDVEDTLGSLTVEVSIDGGAWLAAPWNTVDAYEYSWDTTAIGDGAHTVDARATDSASQTMVATQVNVTVDNVGDVPVVSITAPLEAATVSGNAYTVSVDATDDIDALGSLTVEVSIDGGPWLAAPWNTVDAYEYSWDTTAIGDGPHTVDARATDSDVNTGNATQVNVTVDNVGDVPVVSITAPLEAATVSGNAYTVSVDATDDIDALGSLTVEVSIDGGPWLAAPWNTVDAYEYSWDTTAIGDGPHTVDARATDSDVNTGNATQVNVTVDNVGDVPVVSITAPLEAATVSGNAYTVSVDATDDVDALGSLTVEVSIDGGPWLAAPWNTVDAYEYTWDTTAIGDGPHTVDARATDSDVNTGNATQVNVTSENDADPVVSITDPTNGSNVAGTITVSVDATDAEDTLGSLTVEVSIDGGPWLAAPWNTVDAYEYSWDTTAIADGSHTVDARATDSALQTTNATQVSVDTGLAPEVLADGPVGYWRLGEASGTTAGDAAVPADDGTYVGAPTLGVTGLVSGIDTAVDFDGTDDTVTASLTGMSTTLRTVELWFSADTVVSRQVLAQVSNPASGVAVYLDGTDLWISSWNATQGTISGSMTVAAGTTYHLVVVYDTAGTFEAYLDGSATAAITVAGATGTLGAAMDVTIGSVTADIEFHDGPGAGGNFFDGVIDEVAVYDTVLTTTRITAHNTAATAV